MKQFQYRALNKDGIQIRGRLAADSLEAAVSQLQARGLLILQLQDANKVSVLDFTALSRQPLSATGLARFTQQLATLLSAGQPLERALGILVRQPGSLSAKQLIERLREGIKAGNALSTAMAEENKQFSDFYLSLVRAGEAGGALAETLMQLAQYLERTEALRGEITNALIYPAFLVVGVLGSLVLLLTYVVPQFVPIFNSLNIPLPLITEAILQAGDLLNAYGLYCLALLAFLIYFTVKSLQDPVVALKWGRWLLQVKVIGPLLQRLETARFSRTLGTLLSQGVPLLTGLSISQQVASNHAIQLAIKQAESRAKGGSTLSGALESTGQFPELAVQMIQVGEESGQLDIMLLKLAQVYDDEARRTIKGLLAALVPMLTLTMAALVALIMLAIMLPLMSLTSNI